MFGVNINFAQVDRLFAAAQKQVIFAASKALTDTAYDIQAEVRKELPERFTIRTTWIAKGIKVTKATNNNLKATVYVKDQFMAVQEEGGVRSLESGKAPAIPVGARKRKTDLTRPGKYPGKLMAKKGHFIAPISSGGHRYGVWHRTGKKQVMPSGRYEGKKRQPLALMYMFSRDSKIKPRFGFEKTAKRVAGLRIQKRFVDALRYATATAK
ncbi:MAG: hypothetical protein HQL75_00415 [Magnetococcales bacterium]|nr:hypothetical protein [Magnetococcales bacterium]